MDAGEDDAVNRTRDLLQRLRGNGLHAPPFDSLTTEDQRVWVQAVSAANVGAPLSIRSEVSMDLAETSLLWAFEMLNWAPKESCTLVFSRSNHRTGVELAQRYGCAPMEVPNALLGSPFSWALVYRDACAWSRGIS